MKKIIVSAGLLIASLLLWGKPAQADPNIPGNSKDVLAACHELTATGPIELSQAIGMVQSCLDNLYPNTGNSFTVIAQSGSWAADPTCRCDWAPVCQREPECRPVDGIVITVKGQLPDNSIVKDLEYSLDQHQALVFGHVTDMLLGYPAYVDDLSHTGEASN